MEHEGEIIVFSALIILILFVYTFYYAITLNVEKSRKSKK